MNENYHAISKSITILPPARWLSSNRTNVNLELIALRKGLGSDITPDIVSLNVVKPPTWGKHTWLHWWSLGGTTKDTTDRISPFSLGGLFSLSGYASGELQGKHLGVGRLIYYLRLGEQVLNLFNTPFYIGGSIEAGNVWQSSNEFNRQNTLLAASAFVVFDSFVGPLYLAYGSAEGDRHSAYLFLGQTF